MEARKRYGRKSTNTTVSSFYEHYQLSKYNFDPPYQRDKNVWNPTQKSFLIDTIMKNFPIPPIFLEQKIDESTGKTTFDVIDGKQRLFAIVDFIEGEIQLPGTFGDDVYGNQIMNGKTFDELKLLSKEDKEIHFFILDFWSYVINVEYIENPDIKVVDNIFDRLNRGGEKLNPQELRKANYYDSIVYSDTNNLKYDEFISELLRRLNKTRLEDVSFITEIYLLIKGKKIIDGVETQIDKYFKEIVDEVEEEESQQIVNTIHEVKKIVSSFNLDYDLYKITGVSHLYAVWYLAYYILQNNITVDEDFIAKLNEFYFDLRNERDNQFTIEYHKSMQSASKYKSSRRKRIAALLSYFELEYDIERL